MSQTEATRQADNISPLMVDGSGNPAGAALAVTTTAGTLDLTTVPGLPGSFSVQATTLNPNPIGHYITLVAEGGDCYVNFGPSSASIATTNAPSPAAVNTITSGSWASTKGVCMYIPAGNGQPLKLWTGGIMGQSSPCRWMGYVTKSGTATLRVWQSSD